MIKESSLKTNKIKKISFGDIYTFFNYTDLISIRYQSLLNLNPNNFFMKVACSYFEPI